MSEIRMPDINSVLIAGNLTRDPAFRKTTNGTPVTNFWIASNRKFKDNNGQWRENVCYVGVVAWYKLAESCSENLRKGSAVIVEGELQSRSLRSDDGRNRNIVEIKARRIQFLNKVEESIEEEHTVTPEIKKEIITEKENVEKPLKNGKEDDIDEQVEKKETSQIKEEDDNRSLSGDYNFGFQDMEV